jgi:hypothetical protein
MAALVTVLVERQAEVVFVDYSSSDHWQNEPWETNDVR